MSDEFYWLICFY